MAMLRAGGYEGNTPVDCLVARCEYWLDRLGVGSQSRIAKESRDMLHGLQTCRNRP